MTEKQIIEIHFTSGSLDEARKISRYLVQERLVAAAQIIPWIESITMWNNQLETFQETKVIFKTLQVNFEQVKRIVLENSKYDVPEITSIHVAGGNSEYLDWIRESASPLINAKIKDESL